ncbi:unnamed protein product [Camellia sinensis]
MVKGTHAMLLEFVGHFIICIQCSIQHQSLQELQALLNCYRILLSKIEREKSKRMERERNEPRSSRSSRSSPLLRVVLYRRLTLPDRPALLLSFVSSV